MTTLLVVKFPHATTAGAAADDVLLLEQALGVQRDAVVTVSRDEQGVFHVGTNHVLGRNRRGSFWHVLLGAVLFLPLSPGPPSTGISDVSQQLARLGMDQNFQQEVRDMLAPGTSALLLLAPRRVAADVLPSLRRLGGVPVMAALAPDVEDQVLRTLDAELLFGWSGRQLRYVPADRG